MDPELPNINSPVPEALMEPPLEPRVNKRSIVTAAPVYMSVPPFKTRFDAALVAAPILLLDPPLAKVEADNVPALIVVTPV